MLLHCRLSDILEKMFLLVKDGEARNLRILIIVLVVSHPKMVDLHRLSLSWVVVHLVILFVDFDLLGGFKRRVRVILVIFL